ncbi:Protein of unknown function [Gryllus bimaculatus]|nr:Protein of unknown function [Gryllus bimaculatus]
MKKTDIIRTVENSQNMHPHPPKETYLRDDEDSRPRGKPACSGRAGATARGDCEGRLRGKWERARSGECERETVSDVVAAAALARFRRFAFRPQGD